MDSVACAVVGEDGAEDEEGEHGNVREEFDNTAKAGEGGLG